MFELDWGDLPIETLQPVEPSPARLTLYQQSIRNLELPSVVWNQFQAATQSGASSHQLAEIIKTDPVLSAAVLKAANCGGMVLVEIVDVDRAIARIGHSMTRGIVARHAFGSPAANAGKVYDLKVLWKHGIAVSVLAEVIARFIPDCDAHLAGTLGLFHDIGRMGFNLIPEFMQPATLDYETGHLVYEQARFSCSHVDMGRLVARHWQLPRTVEQGIELHHEPAYSDAATLPESIRAELLAVYLADLLAIRAGHGHEDAAIALPHPSFAAMLSQPLAEIANDRQVCMELDKLEHLEV